MKRVLFLGVFILVISAMVGTAFGETITSKRVFSNDVVVQHRLDMEKNARVTFESGSTMTFASGSSITYASGTNPLFTLGAANYVKIDGATTTHTGATGALDINFSSKTDNSEAVNIFAQFITGGTGQSVAGLEIETDNDSGNASDVLYGIIINGSDTTATGKSKGLYVKGAGMDAAIQCDTGYIRIGTGSTPDVTPGDDDLYVEGTVEVDGAARFDGAVSATSTLAVTSTSTLTGAVTCGNDVAISAATKFGNGAVTNELTGKVRIACVAPTAGSDGTDSNSLVDDSPTGEWAPVDADVTEAEGSADAIFKVGTSSYKATFADTATAGDGFSRAWGDESWEALESIGFWFYPTATVVANDLEVTLTDDGVARQFNIGALTANTWNWVEVDISSLNAGTGDHITAVKVDLTAQGAANADLNTFSIYMDNSYSWDADDEKPLYKTIIQDGVNSVDTEDGTLVEYTDYFTHYESGADFIVFLSNQSGATDVVATVSY